MKFCRRINQLDNGEIKTHWISRFLKKEIGYWYKRGSSRSHLSMDKKFKYEQNIWAWQILQDLHSNITYINVDESSFTKSTKTWYSWNPKGQDSPIINTWGTGIAVMLFTLLSSGDWVSYISNNTTDSEQFWNFILIVNKFIELWTHIRITQTRILLDNASIHLSKFTKYRFQKVRIENGVPSSILSSARPSWDCIWYAKEKTLMKKSRKP